MSNNGSGKSAKLVGVISTYLDGFEIDESGLMEIELPIVLVLSDLCDLAGLDKSQKIRALGSKIISGVETYTNHNSPVTFLNPDKPVQESL